MLTNDEKEKDTCGCACACTCTPCVLSCSMSLCGVLVMMVPEASYRDDDANITINGHKCMASIDANPVHRASFSRMQGFSLIAAAAVLSLSAGCVLRQLHTSHLWAVPPTTFDTPTSTTLSRPPTMARPMLHVAMPSMKHGASMSASSTASNNAAGPSQTQVTLAEAANPPRFAGFGLAAIGTLLFGLGLIQRPRKQAPLSTMELRASASDVEVPRGMCKLYTLEDTADGAAVELVSGQFHCLKPDPSRDDEEFAAFEETFEDYLPAQFSRDRFRYLTPDQLREEYDLAFGESTDDFGSLTSLDDFVDLRELAAVLMEEAGELDRMHKQGWGFEGVEDGWCMASIEPGEKDEAGLIKVYTFPQDTAAASVKLASGEYHCLRPRSADDVTEDFGMPLLPEDQTDEQIMQEMMGLDMFEEEEEEEEEEEMYGQLPDEEFTYVESIDTELQAPFKKDCFEMMTPAVLEDEYDVNFGTEAFNYGVEMEDADLHDLRDVANQLRARAKLLTKMHDRGWRVMSVDEQWLTAKIDILLT